MKKLSKSIIAIFLLMCVNIAFACINDASSKYFESQPFPDEDQLISGSFHIHSPDFYEWRIKDRLNKLKEKPNDAALLDDLAVSFEKIGQTKKGIDILSEALQKYPNRYETLANLGTLYIHDKQYEKGLGLLKKAIIINPAAHYGREIYQIKAVEYILGQPNKVFPIQTNKNFADFVLKGVSIKNEKDELVRAIVGISGMLKFGNSDSPILLELLGDLYARIVKDYIDKPRYETDFNPISLIAKNFYIAAFIRSDLKDKKIIINFIENRPNILFINQKKLYRAILETDLPPENVADDIQRRIEYAKEARAKQFEQEAEIIKTSNNPEQVIFNEVLNKPAQQSDLFISKKQHINSLILTHKFAEIVPELQSMAIVFMFAILVAYICLIFKTNYLEIKNTLFSCVKWLNKVIGALIVSLIIAAIARPLFVGPYSDSPTVFGYIFSVIPSIIILLFFIVIFLESIAVFIYNKKIEKINRIKQINHIKTALITIYILFTLMILDYLITEFFYKFFIHWIVVFFS